MLDAGLLGARWWLMLGNGLGGAFCEVGVGIGVFCEDKEIDAGFSNADFVVLSGT